MTGELVSGRAAGYAVVRGDNSRSYLWNEWSSSSTCYCSCSPGDHVIVITPIKCSRLVTEPWSTGFNCYCYCHFSCCITSTKLLDPETLLWCRKLNAYPTSHHILLFSSKKQKSNNMAFTSCCLPALKSPSNCCVFTL
jgi:hypothetical protein